MSLFFIRYITLEYCKFYELFALLNYKKCCIRFRIFIKIVAQLYYMAERTFCMKNIEI